MALEIINTLESRRAYEIARMPSALECSQLWSNPGDGFTDRGLSGGIGYVTHSHGDRGETYVWFHSDADKRKFLCARRAASDMLSLDVGWHYGKIARQITEWLGIRQRPLPAETHAVILPYWHYQYCRPVDLETAALYDMCGAYWQVASRCKSPLLYINPENDKIIWGCLTSEQEERWERLKEVVKAHKRLRLAIIGVNSVGWRQTPLRKVSTWYRGKPFSRPRTPTSLQPLALLTVRTSFELTQLAARDSAAWYSNCDSIMTEGNPPKYWDDCGIEYRTVATGPANVQALGAYRVGEYRTVPFDLMYQTETVRFTDAKTVSHPVYHEQVFA